MKALLAKKVGMTQIFDSQGLRSGVTVLKVESCVVTKIKDNETDGYQAVQLGFGKAKRIGKSLAGQLKQSKAQSSLLKEVRLDKTNNSENLGDFNVGDEITPDIFEVGEKVSVSAVSKGKGFAGTIKRHNFHRGPKTHGSHNYRAPGSIGAGYPQHVFKGQKMAGQMGHGKVTTKNLKIAMIDKQNNLIALVGSVPGPRKGVVLLKGVSS